MASEVTIFYAADLHGSDRCFKKWLNAGQHYGADVIVIGGDLTGKVLVPVYPATNGGDQWTSTWHGRRVDLETKSEVEQFSRNIREEGAYAHVTTPEEVEEIQASIEKEREVFVGLKTEALEEWIRWADERLAGKAVRALIMPGNDDNHELDPLLQTSRCLENVHGSTVELAPGIVMASYGESTPTPWHTPREIPDEDLGRRVADVTSEIPDDAVAIWNVHNPPHDTEIDKAPKIDDELRVQYDSSGGPIMVPVGSTSVRRLIEQRQPAVALHGHIHEGRGRYKLGKTVGFNPGSVYSEGTLQGVLLRVSVKKGVRSYTFTAG